MTPLTNGPGSNRRPLPLLVLAGLALFCGVWAGLVRIGWQWPSISPASHGSLMISGFLGTLISLERAVALRQGWTYTAPLLSGLGSLLILPSAPDWLVHLAFVLASLSLFGVFAVAYWQHYQRHIEPSALTMLVGSASWLIGNLLWLFNRPLCQVSVWWLAFLVLTIAGERLELARVHLRQRVSVIMFTTSVSLLGLGLIASVVTFTLGLRLAGASVIALGAWLLSFDIARRTIRQTGLSRFMAACLLPGYVWLLVSGGLWLVWAEYFIAGPFYDAMLHTILIGFVFSMIFGHAPLILPAVTGIAIPYSPRFYLHLLALHLSLCLRLWGDLASQPPVRAWGGLLNALAIVMFLISTAWAARSARVKLNATTHSLVR
jgi:hypothetical protein